MLGHALPDFVYKEKTRSRLSYKRPSNVDEISTPTARLLVIYISVFAVFLILLAAAIRLQIFEGTYYRDLANNNRIREIPIHAPRGIIYDKNDIPLVVNLPAFRLKECNSKCTTSTISKDQAILLESSGLKKNQTLEIDSVRSYPYGKTTAHLLGYVSIGDKVGYGGIEEQYESVLKGQDGKELIEVDAMGKKIRSIKTVPAIPGKNLHLSVDLNLQKVAYNEIKDKKAAAVVSDPNTGQILAIVSAPSFDPNVFTDLNLSEEDRQKGITNIFSDKNQPLFDRAIGGTYPPGSTFKLITSTAGLETGSIKEDTVIDDPGILIVGPYKFGNWLYLKNGGTQGIINVVSAIQKSNDIFFYRVGEWTGFTNLTNWMYKFGLGKKSNIDLPNEAKGNVPLPSKDWYLGDTYHLAIGQGDMLTTPLQVNFWTNVIANKGNLCQPQVNKNNSICHSLNISPKTLSLVEEGMILACKPEGTAYPLFGFKIPLACKTGTAEFGDPKDRTHAWLTAFGPVNKPTISATVLIEAGGEGSDVAAPVVKKIFEEWFQ